MKTIWNRTLDFEDEECIQIYSGTFKLRENLGDVAKLE